MSYLKKETKTSKDPEKPLSTQKKVLKKVEEKGGTHSESPPFNYSVPEAKVEVKRNDGKPPEEAPKLEETE